MWYDQQKICFECTGCGACCKRHGEVYVTDKELAEIINYMDTHHITNPLTHIRQEHEGLWAIPIPEQGACPLLGKDDRCTVHEVKPWQCRAYPFWPEVMQSKDSWTEEGLFCEGINRGKEHPSSEIEAQMKDDPFMDD